MLFWALEYSGEQDRKGISGIVFFILLEESVISQQIVISTKNIK